MGYSLPQVLHRRSEEVGDVSTSTPRSGNASPIVVIPSEARDLGSLPSRRKPRFLVASLLGMTRRWVDARHHPLRTRLSCYSSLASYQKKVKILTLVAVPLSRLRVTELTAQIGPKALNRLLRSFHRCAMHHCKNVRSEIQSYRRKIL